MERGGRLGGISQCLLGYEESQVPGAGGNYVVTATVARRHWSLAGMASAISLPFLGLVFFKFYFVFYFWSFDQKYAV